jgi:hypothetical protein
VRREPRDKRWSVGARSRVEASAQLSLLLCLEGGNSREPWPVTEEEAEGPGVVCVQSECLGCSPCPRCT